jgi:hypothetical protein
MNMVYLEITLNIVSKDRPTAASVYTRYKAPFLAQVKGATSKDLLIRDEDVRVLHGFDSVDTRSRISAANSSPRMSSRP